MKKIIVVLIVSLATLSSVQSQCSRGEHDCWISEGVANIDASDFKAAKKAFRKARVKASKEEKNLAKKLRSKLEKVYKPLVTHREKSKEKKNARFFKEALNHLKQGDLLAERNLKTSVEATQELDESLKEYFTSTIPTVEKERLKAVQDSFEKANASFDDGEYEAALVLYDFVTRETLDSEPLKSEATQKSSECKFNIALQKATNSYDAGDYENALKFANTALSYNSSDVEVKRIRDESIREIYKSKYEEAKRMVNDTGGENCEKAIALMQEAKLYYRANLSEDYGSPDVLIKDAKDCATTHYLGKATKDYEINSHINALRHLNKAKEFSKNALISFDGNDYDYNTLLDKFYNDKITSAKDNYSSEKFDESIKDFRAVSVYAKTSSDSLQMTKNIAFVKAVKKAMKLENKKSVSSSVYDKQKLKEAWEEASRLSSSANFGGTIEIERKLQNARQAYENASVKSARLQRGYVSGISLRPIENIINFGVPHDANNGNDNNLNNTANVTAYVRYRLKPSDPKVIQATFTVKFNEDTPNGMFTSNIRTVFQYIEEKDIDILEIPNEYKDFKPTGLTTNYSAPIYFWYKDVELKSRPLKNFMSTMYLRSNDAYISDIKIRFLAGRKINFSFRPNTSGMILEKK